jgi:hypothetical protein
MSLFSSTALRSTNKETSTPPVHHHHQGEEGEVGLKGEVRWQADPMRWSMCTALLVCVCVVCTGAAADISTTGGGGGGAMAAETSLVE